MKITPEIFRAYDIRGIYPNDLSDNAIEHIGKSIGTRLQERGLKTIVIGRDGRLSGPSLSKHLTNGLLSTGCHVVDIGLAPTPMIYYAGKKLSEGSCVAITGSHNPSDYNGLKIVLNNETLATDNIQMLKNDTLSENYKLGSGNYQVKNIQNLYIDEISKQCPMNKKLKVVIDAGNGVAGGVAPDLLNAIGHDVIELYCDVDGHFPNHHPDPSKLENLKYLINAVKEKKADIGIAYDGDGDRIGIIDCNGNVINADRFLMLFAKQVLEENPECEILFDVKCSTNLKKWITNLGGKATMCRTGHSFVKKAIQETQAKLAGEMSGHIFFNDRWYGFDDALYSTARLLEILSNTNDDLSKVFKDLPNSINTPELNINTLEGENFSIVESLKKTANFKNATITTLDGLRVDFDNGWGLVRASNTTPMLVLRFEANTQENLNSIQQQFKELLLPLCHQNIPF